MATKDSLQPNRIDNDPDLQVNVSDSKEKIKAKMMLRYIREGLTIDDGLILADWTHDEYEEYKRKNKKYDKLTRRKSIEYKRDLLLPINTAIEKGNNNLAQWMLETKYPDEFGKRKKTNDDESSPVQVILNAIQQGDSVKPAAKLIREEQKKIAREIEFENLTNNNSSPMDVLSTSTVPPESTQKEKS